MELPRPGLMGLQKEGIPLWGEGTPAPAAVREHISILDQEMEDLAHLILCDIGAFPLQCMEKPIAPHGPLLQKQHHR